MNEKPHLDRDGLDGIYGGPANGEPAPAYQHDESQSSRSSRTGFGAFFLVVVLGGALLYFFLGPPSETAQPQKTAQGDTIPKVEVSTLSKEVTTPKRTIPVKKSAVTTVAAVEAEKAGTLEPLKTRPLKDIEEHPEETATLVSPPLTEPQHAQEAGVAEGSQKKVRQEEPSRHPPVPGSARERPLAMETGEKLSLEARQEGEPPPSAHPAAATVASTSLPDPVTIHFHWNTTEPFDWDEEKIDAVRGLIQKCPDGVEIVGHTCNIGTRPVNYLVGLGRAQVVHQLLKEAGIQVRGVRLRSAGDTQPVADNRTRQGRAQNRRAVIACIKSKAFPE